jgi:Ca2+-binding EF-hand superfamily protein
MEIKMWEKIKKFFGFLDANRDGRVTAEDVVFAQAVAEAKVKQVKAEVTEVVEEVKDRAEAVKEEVAKCKRLCANCHREEHYIR